MDMFIIPLLITILIIYVFANMFRSPQVSRSVGKTLDQPTVSKRPIDILNERYAKGEITEEEFLKIKRNLT